MPVEPVVMRVNRPVLTPATCADREASLKETGVDGLRTSLQLRANHGVVRPSRWLLQSLGSAGVCLLAACAIGFVLPASASAGRLVTIETQSSYVNPSEEPMGPPPAGAPDRTKALRVNVMLPDGYARHPNRRYPVLYLLHGITSAYDYWTNPERGDARSVLAGFPGIVVMPEGGGYGLYSDWWNAGALGRPRWESYHLRELVPLIERRFRIRSGRRWHAIAGLSVGGYGAVYYATQRPGYFGSVASFSGALAFERATDAFACDTGAGPYSVSCTSDILGPTSGFYAQGHNAIRLVEALRATRVYVSSGNGVICPGDSAGAEFDGWGPDAPAVFNPPLVIPTALATFPVTEIALRDMMDRFANAARAAGVSVTERRTCGIHWWDPWRRALADARRWGFFQAVEKRPTEWTYITASRSGRMWSLRFRFAAPMTAVATFERDRKFLTGTGQGIVTLRRHGCRLEAELPFTLALPQPCR